MRELWGWRDARTGQRVSATSTHTREQAEAQLAEWLARDARGKRPDLHDLMPHVEVYRIVRRPGCGADPTDPTDPHDPCGCIAQAKQDVRGV